MTDVSGAAEERRPSPRKLLELARKEGAGKLKVFLGAAPGVGKTYAMLSAARARKAEGADVVVGVIETHGRSETAALLDGLEVMARKPVTYRGRTLLEFDIDAAIARRPKLLLIDEFAHSNAPGVLHTKRYQDVIEALNAGIDVWTTLNIQHLESLKDVVERITGVIVREIVPDTALERADEIVIVDLPPDELIKRLKEGKVYLPENARRAIDQFFKPGNLTALRELALRRTADRVDEKLLEHLRRNAVSGAFPTVERLLVCVGDDDFSEKVVRTAARMATTLKFPWHAVQLQPAGFGSTGKPERRRAEKWLRLADRLGADVVRLTGRDIVGEILRYASDNNVTQIVIGRSARAWPFVIFGRSLSDAFVHSARDIAVTVVAPDVEERPIRSWAMPKLGIFFPALVASVIAVALALGVALSLRAFTPLPNAPLIFLIAVLGCAIRFGVTSAVAASVLSSVAYNFFFIEPRYTLTVAQPYEVVSLVTFLVVAMLTAGLAGRLRQQSDLVSEQAQVTQALYEYAGKLAGAASLTDVIALLVRRSAQAAQGSSVVLLWDGTDLVIRGSEPPRENLANSDWAAARWSFKRAQAAGRFTGTMPNADFHFRPIAAGETVRGVAGIAPNDKIEDFSAAMEAEIQALIDQGAVAIERTRLVDEAAKAGAAIESERLRNVLLSSVSHDLRTPLASIMGSVTSLRSLGDRMSKAERADLLVAIEEETERLARFVSNLLDMTKIEAGALNIRRDRIDVADVVRSAVARARKAAPARAIDINLGADLALVQGDASLLEQVLFNLLDNADKYASVKSVTTVSAVNSGKEIAVSVADQGVGIANGQLLRVFEKFYRGSESDGRAAGTGLGLSICKGIVDAMGGTIAAESPVVDGRGTRVTIRLPIAQPAALSAKETGG